MLLDGDPVRSCIVLAPTIQGRGVTTVEGLSQGGDLHPVQRAFHEHGASQCGFCTPGMVLTAESLLRRQPNPDRDAVGRALAGNLCRCTGYVKIVDATLAAAEQGATTEGESTP